jgi:cytochrome P450
MPQLYYTEIAHRYNIQGIFYLDLWPIGPGLVIITDPKLLEQAPVPRPLPPHPMTDTFMAPMVGENVIPTKGGLEWKKLHNAMSPAFSTAHARSLVNVMVDEGMFLRSKLDELSATSEVFSMEELISKVVFGIVSRHALNVEAHAQTTGSQDLADMRELVNLAREESDPRIAYNPLVQIPRRLRRYRVRTRLEESLLGVVYKRLEALVSEGVVPMRQNPTSVLDLMFREHMEAATETKEKGRGGFMRLSMAVEKHLLNK